MTAPESPKDLKERLQRAWEWFLQSDERKWAVTDQIMIKLAPILIIILLARLLGIEGFGRFYLVWMVVLLAGSLQEAAILAPMRRIGPMQSEENVTSYYGAVLIQQFVFAVGGFIVVGLAALAIDRLFPDWGLGGLALPLAVALIAQQLQDYLRHYFLVTHRPKAAFFNDAICYLGQLAILGTLLMLGEPMGVRKAFWAIAAASGLAAAYGLCIVGVVKVEEDMLRDVLRRHWFMAKWLLVSTLVEWISSNYLIVMAGTWLGAAAVGALKAAENLVGISLIAFRGFSRLMPIRLKQVYAEQGLARLETVLTRLSMAGVCLMLWLLAPALLLPHMVMDQVYGKEFAPYGWVLLGYAWLYGMVFATAQMTLAMNALELRRKESRATFICHLLGSLISVVFAYPLIYHLKITGVIAGFLLIQVTQLFFLGLSYWHKRKQPELPLAPDEIPSAASPPSS